MHLMLDYEPFCSKSSSDGRENRVQIYNDGKVDRLKNKKTLYWG